MKRGIRLVWGHGVTYFALCNFTVTNHSEMHLLHFHMVDPEVQISPSPVVDKDGGEPEEPDQSRIRFSGIHCDN
ncbi:hypothetical protein GQ457_13G015380 [Hibiscus cannabinus]